MEASGAETKITAPLAALLAGIPLPAFVIDAEDRIHACNDSALSLLGSQAEGRNIALVLRNADLLEGISAVRADLAPRQVAMRQTDDARFDARLSPLPQPDGAAAVLCVLRDVATESRHEAMRRDFVANLSHELRTPLTAMTGFIETLQGPAKEDASARDRFLAIMAQEAERMNRLVRDLLHLGRVESLERMRPKEQVDLLAILTNACATLRPLAAQKGVSLIWDPPAPLPPPRGDGDQLLQVFLNLIENAIKYGRMGGEVRLTLACERASRGKRLAISIADQGEGIAPEHLPRLTERFYRVDNHRSRAEGGTGLGLAIVKHILNRHQGRLQIASRRGEGSVFTVILPLED